MESFDNAVRRYTTLLDDPYVSGMVVTFLIAYTGLAAPKLPQYITKLFDYTVTKFFLFFMIVYIVKRSATVALVSSIALLIIILALNNLKIGKNGTQNTPALNYQEEAVASKVTTEDGILVANEAKKLQDKELLHPVHVDTVVNVIANVEKEGKPVLAAKTSEGIKHMNDIAEAENKGMISEDDAKKMVAKVVVHEIVQEYHPQTEQPEQVEQRRTRCPKFEKTEVAEHDESASSYATIPQ